jgi:hypothetical protein
MRTLQSAAILLGLSAGLGAVFNSPAQAQVQTCGFTQPANIVCGVPALPSPVFTPDAISAGAGTISFENPAGSMYSVKTGFAPTINTASVTEQFKYSLTLTDGKIWGKAGLTTNMLAGFPGGKFSKQICADAFGGTACITAMDLNTLTLSNTGVSPFIDISYLGANKIYVTDTYQSVVGNPMGYGQISDFTNTFEAVPGPLPVLGAGAAFGFSRKLRKRIKSAG